jgi:hypothetical protein
MACLPTLTAFAPYSVMSKPETWPEYIRRFVGMAFETLQEAQEVRDVLAAEYPEWAERLEIIYPLYRDDADGEDE